MTTPEPPYSTQRFSEERVPSGTSGYLWNQKTTKSNNKNRGEEIRWVNYQATYWISANKKPRSMSGVLKLGAWQCPTLAWRMPHYH
ncbi:hypothetical protein ACK337_20205, partial [Aeromonas veronii]